MWRWHFDPTLERDAAAQSRQINKRIAASFASWLAERPYKTIYELSERTHAHHRRILRVLRGESQDIAILGYLVAYTGISLEAAFAPDLMRALERMTDTWQDMLKHGTELGVLIEMHGSPELAAWWRRGRKEARIAVGLVERARARAAKESPRPKPDVMLELAQASKDLRELLPEGWLREREKRTGSTRYDGPGACPGEEGNTSD